MADTTTRTDELRPVDVTNLEKELVAEMSTLSMQDRNKIHEEIHGVATLCPEETPEMMAQSLHTMQKEIDKISSKHVYNQVSALSYIHTDNFRLRFLRCELYDCKKAAERLIRFTEYIETEFGLEMLERPLRLEDLQTHCRQGKAVMDSLRVGHSQILPFRDRSGRKVMSTHLQSALNYNLDIRVSTTKRIFWGRC